MEALQQIHGFLATTRRHLRLVALGRATLYWLAMLALALLLVPTIAAALEARHGVTIAALGGAFVVVGTAVAIAFGVIAPFRRWRRNTSVARYVGARKPPLASDLLSTVELSQSPPKYVSEDLITALIRQTAARVDAIAPSSLMPPHPLRRAGLVCTAAIAVHAAVFFLLPGTLLSGWLSIINTAAPGPFGGAAIALAPLVSDMRITLDYPAYTKRPPLVLPSSSGDFRAMPGTVVTIETTALDPIASAKLLFTEAPDEQGKQAPDQQGPDSGAGPDDREMVDAGAAQDPTQPDKDKDKARGTSPLLTELGMEVGKEGRLRARFPVQMPAQYRFLTVLPNGRRRVEALIRRIEIEPDLPPEVTLYAPGDEIDVTSLKRIELAYIAGDDYGISKIELVWQGRGEPERKELPLVAANVPTVQSKFLWDLAEISLEPGVQVRYHLEVTDNDAISGPKVTRSKSYSLRIFSPREKHEQLIERQREFFEKLVRSLGERLTVPGDDVRALAILSRDLQALIVELGTLLTAIKADELTTADLSVALSDMRSRMDKLTKAEAELLAKLNVPPGAEEPKISKQLLTKLGGSNQAIVTEVEDNVILLANWLDRQSMENLLAISDEIKVHQDRLRQLFEEYERTGSAELLAEIEREIRALQKRMGEMAQKRSDLAEDVLDRFINAEALKDEQAMSCMDEARALLAKGDAAAAQRKLAGCMQSLDQATEAMEQALQSLRSDAFTEEERKLGEIMDKLSDVAQDQREIAEAADDLWERYAERVDEMMRDQGSEARKNVGKLVQRLREQLDEIPKEGLTPFAQEELEIVEARLRDVDKMLEDGDIAEALAMARQAELSLETMAGEIEAAIEDDHGEPWSRQTRAAGREIERALPLSRRLVEELEAATPSPRDIMSPEDRRSLDRLRRRQQGVAERARRLSERARQVAGELPGRASDAISQGIDNAQNHMKRAGDRMGAQDPAGSRQESGNAADMLEQTLKNTRDAARGRQDYGRAGLRDEPVRIPGANEYKAPEAFREDILEAMKREQAPQGFSELVKRYYEELIR